jgi:hypothetical protein
MRTEALVYVAIATAAVLALRLLRRDRVLQVLGLGVATISGVVAPLVANQLFERLVLGSSLRSGRAAGTAGAAGSGLTGRVGEAFITTFGVNGFPPPRDVVAGVVVVALVGLGVGALAFRRAPNMLAGVGALSSAGVVLVARFADGLGFLPGMLVASPLAVVGVVHGWRDRRSIGPLVVAGTALPVVWFFQYQGGARPQWGGRYVLLSGVLLAVVGVVVLRHRRVALVAALALSLVVTALGVGWLSERSHAVADGMSALVARHDQAVVSTDAHLLREGGAFYTPDRHWLTATTHRDLRRAADIVARAGDRELAVVGPADEKLPRRLGGFTRRGTRTLEVLPGNPLSVVTYLRE